MTEKTYPGIAWEQAAAILVAPGFDMLGEPPAAWHPVVWFQQNALILLVRSNMTGWQTRYASISILNN